MIETEKIAKEVPTWWADMEFCHVCNPGDSDALCGIDTTSLSWCPSDYDGEAICEDCGSPVCPRCAQLSEMEWQLEASN